MTLTSAEVLALFAISVDISGPDGYSQVIDVSNNYALPDDGEYRVVISPFELPGRYELTVRVKGERPCSENSPCMLRSSRPIPSPQ